MPNHCYYLAISFTNHLYLYSYYLLARHAFALFERTTSSIRTQGTPPDLSNAFTRRFFEISINWRASVASETLTGVKMKNSGMFICIYVWTYVRHFSLVTSLSTIYSSEDIYCGMNHLLHSSE